MAISVSNTHTLPTATTMVAVNANTLANTTHPAPVAVINIPVPVLMQPTHATVVLGEADETLFARLPNFALLPTAHTHDRLGGMPVHNMLLLRVVTHPTRVEVAAAGRPDEAPLLVVSAGVGDAAHGAPLTRRDTRVWRPARDANLARVAVEGAGGGADAAHVARRAVV